MQKLVIGKREALNNWVRKFLTYIDIDAKAYKVQETVLGIFKSGIFKPLPKVDYVLVFKNYFSKCAACSIDGEDDNPDSFYQVSLVHNKTRRIVVHETKNRSEAFDMATNLGSLLTLPIKDSASNRRQSTWLNKINAI